MNNFMDEEIHFKETKLESFNDEEIRKYLSSINLGDADYFIAVQTPSTWKYMLFGIFSMLSDSKTYFVVFNNKKVYLLEQSMMSRKSIINYYTIPWDNIKKIDCKSVMFNQFKLNVHTDEKKYIFQVARKVYKMSNQEDVVQKFFDMKTSR